MYVLVMRSSRNLGPMITAHPHGAGRSGIIWYFIKCTAQNGIWSYQPHLYITTWLPNLDPNSEFHLRLNLFFSSTASWFSNYGFMFFLDKWYYHYPSDCHPYLFWDLWEFSFPFFFNYYPLLINKKKKVMIDIPYFLF